MFNNLRKWILLALVFLVTMVGCAQSESRTEVRLNQTFVMKMGQAVEVAGENLNIKFKDITEDSRCPKGVVCVWAGQVSALIQISAGDGQEELILTEPGSSPNTIAYRQYTISHQITPYPEAGKAINKADYRLQLTISK